VPIIDSEVTEVLSNAEDSYNKHYKKIKTCKPSIKKGYHVKGRKLPMFEMGIIHGFLDLPQLLAYCKTKNVTLTIYMASIYLWAIYKSEGLEEMNHKPIQIAVPVNLRRFFDSNTTLNFFSYIAATLLECESEIQFDELLQMVKNQFDKQISKEKFSTKIAQDVALRKNPILRITPLFLKNIFLLCSL
jgi:NRPS condensation-like uncharacterized protein